MEVVVVVLGEGLGDRLAGAGVVRAVEDHQRVAFDHLEPAGPVGVAEAAREVGLGYAVTADLSRQHRSDARVPRLVRAGEWDSRLDGPVRARDGDARLGVVDEAVVADGHVRRLALGADGEGGGRVAADGRQ